MTRRADVAEAALPDGRRLVVSSGVLRVLDGGKELARCEIRSWTGEFDAVAPSPDGSVAAVRWNDQTEAGLVLVELADHPRQLSAAWDTRETNWLEGPVWTPDGELLVLVENPLGAGPWWAERTPGEADDGDVSPGGTFSPGSVVALDRGLRERFRELIAVDVPVGWFPAGDADRGLGAPVIGEAGDVVVRVPAEGERRIAISAR
jgi:hypothetical protein